MVIKEQSDEMHDFLKDASNFHGSAEIIFIPETPDEISMAVRNCRSRNIPLTVSGSRTGLTGSGVPLGGALISMEKLKTIYLPDEENKTIKVDPGVTLKELNDFLSTKGWFYPPNPTEYNSSIGGNTATNASGARTFRYGPTREFVESLELVMADGEEIEIKRGQTFERMGSIRIKKSDGNFYDVPFKDIDMPTTKHSAGYYLRPAMDAIDLFIGSEGTLALIKSITLRFIDAPEKVFGGIVFFDKRNNMLDFIDELRYNGAENRDKEFAELTAISPRLIEFFDYKALDLLRQDFPEIPANTTGAVWFEQECVLAREDELIEQYYDLINKYTAYADDTWFAIDPHTEEKLSEFRHSLPLKIQDIISRGALLKTATDTAVQLDDFREFFNYLDKSFNDSGLTSCIFGHIGNCHLHANLFPKNDQEKKQAEEIYRNVLDWRCEKEAEQFRRNTG